MLESLVRAPERAPTCGGMRHEARVPWSAGRTLPGQGGREVPLNHARLRGSGRTPSRASERARLTGLPGASDVRLGHSPRAHQRSRKPPLCRDESATAHVRGVRFRLRGYRPTPTSSSPLRSRLEGRRWTESARTAGGASPRTSHHQHPRPSIQSDRPHLGHLGGSTSRSHLLLHPGSVIEPVALRRVPARRQPPAARRFEPPCLQQHPSILPLAPGDELRAGHRGHADRPSARRHPSDRRRACRARSLSRRYSRHASRQVVPSAPPGHPSRQPKFL
jgi:hypothetical protein